MSDVTGAGDTFHTNELVDNVLVSNRGFCDAAARFYANGHDFWRSPSCLPCTATCMDFRRRSSPPARAICS